MFDESQIEERTFRCWKCGVRPEGDGPSQLCDPCAEYLRSGSAAAS